MATILDSDQLEADLIKEYAPCVNSSTILALISDYDLTDPNQKIAAKQILDFVRESSAEDERDLNSNEGGSNHFFFEYPASATDDSVGRASSQEWNYQNDDSSSHSSASVNDVIKSPTLSEGENKKSHSEILYKSYQDTLFGLNEREKETTLLAMFPTLKAYDIVHTLQKSKGNIELAIDDLMTQSFLEETGIRSRGIDGFVGNDIGRVPRLRKSKKGKKKEILSEVSDDTLLVPQSEIKGSWDIGCENINFLTERLNMSKSQIASIYHETGASLSKTISHIVKTHMEKAGPKVKDDFTIDTKVLELHHDYPSVSISQIKTICEMTRHNPSYAHHVLHALNSDNREQNSSGVQITICHPPLNLAPDKKTAISLLKSKNIPLEVARKSQVLSVVEEKTAQLHEARNAAFRKATAAYRRSKSDRLMAAVATYYAEEGHTYNSQAISAQSAAADLIAASQSSRNHVDLHGLRVQDAVRIARERVTTWWHELSEEIRLGNDAGRNLNYPFSSTTASCYRLVTGSGLHSRDGVSKIKPAVTKMLSREGWKFESGTGTVVVTGLSQSPSKNQTH
ncbi:Smr domain-containing protein [Golovinomyces cichoracearum]|uniref:Smr domain-containing protein n=1 Tax=Golovinomyces cichoracearum TaxID=62708 RepID=A0A420HMS4_9PEZI|nr:Smr domain-containing protein [Golovinomyces cichoracearum]